MSNFNIKNRLIILLFIFTTMILQTYVLNAQIRSRTYVDSMQAEHNGYWYFPQYDQYEVSYPKLLGIPPLSPSMPPDIMLAYIYLDSLMRNIDTHTLYADYLKRWNKELTKNDTIIQAIKYLYKLVDYDPVRFAQYGVNLSKIYSMNFAIINLTSDWFYKYLGGGIFGNIPKNAISLNDMLRADYILRVHVNSVNFKLQRKFPPREGVYQGKYIHLIHATVLDTLKGMVFNNCYQPDPKIKKDDYIQTENSQICFTYGTGPYSNDVVPFKVDSTLLNYDGNLMLHEGQEIIVFLNHGGYLWNYGYDYFDLSLFTVYPVIDGEVKDISHIWSESSSIDYSDWKNIFNAKKDLILNGGY